MILFTYLFIYLFIYIGSLKITQISVLFIITLFKFLTAFTIMNLFNTTFYKLHYPCLLY